MITAHLIKNVDDKVDELINEYNHCPGMILSEDDIKCQLFSKLIHLFDYNISTADEDIYASPIHSEINFFDAYDNLAIKPDITILDPRFLTVKKSNDIDISRKGFAFSGSAIIIEIKFCKSKSGINRKHIESYNNDCRKMLDIHDRLFNSDVANQMHGFFIAFNKTNIGLHRFEHFREQYSHYQNIDIKYGSANLKL